MSKKERLISTLNSTHMSKRITINQMVKEIFFDATKGKRTLENFVDGMTVIERLRYYFYRSYFEEAYSAWLAGNKTSKQIMAQIADSLGNWTMNEEARRMRKTILELI